MGEMLIFVWIGTLVTAGLLLAAGSGASLMFDAGFFLPTFVLFSLVWIVRR